MTKKLKISENKEMSFFNHLESLRGHLVRAIIAIVVGMVIVGVFFDFFVKNIIMAPTRGDFITYRYLNILAEKLGAENMFGEELKIELINLTPTGQITTFLISIFVGGFIIAIPFVIYQFWLFLKPALSESEKKNSYLFLFSGTGLFLTGVLFSYFLILPFSINFLYFFNAFDVTNQWNLRDYLGVFNQTILSLGLVFLLPIIVYILGRMELITSEFLKKQRSYAFVIVLITAAIITPSDFLSMLIAAIPLWGLYELSILILKILEKKRI